ncbi:MAG: diguanylate cyclase [Oscillospiraceae bacterium]|nr:diguanylate cyclase [Oscillospiraceae bacterium]
MLMNIPLTAADFHAFSARYGGDELCLVVIGSSHRPEEVADRLREHLVEIQKGQEPSMGYTVTVSIGYVVRHTPDYSSDDLISRADFYQYQDKRNCHRANEK